MSSKNILSDKNPENKYDPYKKKNKLSEIEKCIKKLNYLTKNVSSHFY